MEATETSPEQYNYPFATSPDILRTHQKDAYMTGTLSAHLNDILRDLLGARFAHRYTNATTHLSELIYLCTTTLLGNRTLGEEYCDVIQVEDDTLRLASLARRLGYIASVVFSPWLLSRLLPALRRKLRSKVERNVARAKQRQTHTKQAPTRSQRIQEYILNHLDILTSLSPIYALSLAAFYFTGSYYHLSKRLFRLRYIFTKKLAPSEQRIGYEVLGVLLVLQLSVQTALHIRQNFATTTPDPTTSSQTTLPQPAPVALDNNTELPLPLQPFSQSSTSLLPTSDLDLGASHPHHTTPLSVRTSTPAVDPDVNPHYSTSESEQLSWIPAGTQRKCTLCLEPFRDPAVTTCGHVFCWNCVMDWVREKPECPLCRQEVLGSKVLPLRGF